MLIGGTVIMVDVCGNTKRVSKHIQPETFQTCHINTSLNLVHFRLFLISFKKELGVFETPGCCLF